MIKIEKIDTIDARALAEHGTKRGFILPFYREPGSYMLLTDTDGSVSHDKIADEFILISEDKVRGMIGEEKYQTKQDFEKVLQMWRVLKKGYDDKRDEYPTARKDFLLYEEGAVAYDARSYYSRSVMFRDSGRGFTISSQTDNIVGQFAICGWKQDPVPDDKDFGQGKFYY